MTVRFKMTDKGEVAILPRKDYEALAAKAAQTDEDFGTARLVARARKEIVAGIPLIPKEVIDRIAAGENALRVFREWRGRTQLYISHKTNLGQGYISDSESGRRKGTTAALKKIAGVLKGPLHRIEIRAFATRRAQPGPDVGHPFLAAIEPLEVVGCRVALLLTTCALSAAINALANMKESAWSAHDDAASATGSIFANFLPSPRRAICRS
jgi:transcriptional regulator with XRE-family HTH domain